MVIAIDYDDTFTAHPDMWRHVIWIMKEYKHRVVCVTNRESSQMKDVYEALDGIIPKQDIFPAGISLKRPFMENKNIHVDIWIDDMPEASHCQYNF